MISSRSRVARAVVTILVGASVPVLLASSPSQAATTRPVDGLTQAGAAGSCWEIKQQDGSAPSGVYWLVTPELKAPQQFYCDQVTDGGGWVLVGRGRQGWKTHYQGLRSPADVRGTVTGPEAFAPAQLPAKTIDGLLNGGNVSALAEGVRLRRATNQTGTAWQEVRFQMPQRTRWAWTFGARHPVGSYTFDGTGSSGGMTYSFGQDTTSRRVDSTSPSAQGFLWGFAFGANVRGSTAASSYIWSDVENAGSGRPFTQMFLRPKLQREAIFTAAVADSGTAKQELRALPDSDAQPTVWGVNGLANGVNNELNVEVQSFAQIGNTVFTGGNFKFVQRDAAGTGQVPQSNLAGFDVNSGEFVSGFRPTLNGQVKALKALPDGRLAVGGAFTSVNGQALTGLAFLDPATGALSGPQVQVEHRNSGGVPAVRGLDVFDGYLYVAGAFTHLVQAPYAASGWNGARVNLANGRPDIRWNPAMNGTSVGVNASTKGDRVYFSGYFTTVKSQSQPKVTAVQPTTDAPQAIPGWRAHFSAFNSEPWQFDVQEVGNSFYHGGAQHQIIGYDRDTMVRQSGSITMAGGDFQTLAANSDTVFGGCHCGDFTYQDAYTWSNPGTTWTQADSIGTFGAWDAATGSYLPDFNPIVKGREGYGAWGTFVDSKGSLWAGGDYQTSIRQGYVNQWSGGFVRFALRDNEAPTSPSGLASADVNARQVRLSWNGSSDASGAVTYEVLEENRVIATTTATSAVIERLGGTKRYFVRAVDANGNRSASTAARSVTSADPDDMPAPPPAPAVSGQAVSSTAVKLTWPAQAGTSFVVTRGSAAVATLPAGATSYDDTGLAAETAYTYRVTARDQYGQEAASSPVTVTTPAAKVLVGPASQWRWRFAATAPEAGWTTAGFDDSTWQSGTGAFGFGSTAVTTDISAGAPSPRPLAAQFRTTFQVGDVSTVGPQRLTFVADDGVVVYVNGVEAQRVNLPAGTIGPNTYATAAPRTSRADAAPVVVSVPASALVNGTNVIAAETHLNYRSTPDALFRAILEAAG